MHDHFLTWFSASSILLLWCLLWWWQFALRLLNVNVSAKSWSCDNHSQDYLFESRIIRTHCTDRFRTLFKAMFGGFAITCLSFIRCSFSFPNFAAVWMEILKPSAPPAAAPPTALIYQALHSDCSTNLLPTKAPLRSSPELHTLPPYHSPAATARCLLHQMSTPTVLHPGCSCSKVACNAFDSTTSHWSAFTNHNASAHMTQDCIWVNVSVYAVDLSVGNI